MIIGLMLSMCFIVNPVSSEDTITVTSGNTLYVGGSGSGNYTKIQDAIDNTSDNDTVFVYSGTYYENVVVNKSITLQGEDNENTIITPKIEDDTVKIISDNVVLSNFKITGKDRTLDIPITMECNNSIIENNVIIAYNGYAISLENSNHNKISENAINGFLIIYASCDFNTIEKNEIGFGIRLGSSHNTINYNTIEGNEKSDVGIKIGGKNAIENKISYNVFKNCGIIVRTKNNEISYNDFTSKGRNAAVYYKGDIFSNEDCYWHHNYWGRPRILPKILFGITIQIGYGNYGISYYFDIAWHPALKPNCAD